jgi:DNA-binding NtrC family response regulator
MLPLVRKELPPLIMMATPHLNKRRQTILVVEDEAAIRNVLHIILRRMGHTVLEACDGAEGLTVSRKFNGPIDLLIADVRMPKVDGPTMAHQLQAERPGIQVLLMSGYSTESVPNDLIKDFLHKPFLPVAVEQKVREMLARDDGISTERGLRLTSAPVRSASANNPGRGTA